MEVYLYLWGSALAVAGVGAAIEHWRLARHARQAADRAAYQVRIARLTGGRK